MSSHQRRLKLVAADDNKKRRNKINKIRGSLAATPKLPLMSLISGENTESPLMILISDIYVAANRKGKN
jgi:hypothetical protein